mmetsp:Transcript_11763/g.26159  ORF Transcript_11763/g.26159 Transcript_11763/m.26159 type:complete len:249 (-) Transcript_11763:66-812(-)
MTTATPTARTMHELEGALLLPEAHVVEETTATTTNGSSGGGGVIEVAASAVSILADDESNNNIGTAPAPATNGFAPHSEAAAFEQAAYAPVLPTVYLTDVDDNNNNNNNNTTVTTSALLRHGEARGQEQARDESRIVRQQNQYTAVHHQHQQLGVAQANARARMLQRHEAQGLVQTTAALAERTDHYKSNPTTAVAKTTTETTQGQSPTTEYTVGTYGQEYEVSDYQVGGDYQTTEYDVKEYKSVYES